MNYRQKKLISLINRSQLNTAVLTSRANKHYFTGYEYEEGYIVINENEIKLFVDPRFTIYAKQEIGGLDVVESKEPFIELIGYLKSFKRIGFDGSGIRYNTFMKLTSELNKNPISFIEDSLLKMRSIKDAEEIDFIRQGADASGIAINKLIGSINTGMTEKEIAFMLNLELIKAGADDISFDTIVAFDEKTAYAHALPSNAIIIGGKHTMLCDFGAVVKGYHTDETHTFFIGDAGSDLKKVYNIVLDAHDRAIDAIKTGIRASSLDHRVRELFDKHGYGKYFGHALGHGVGLDIHESPSISNKSKDVLKNGMVFTIEPGIYIPGWGGIRIESIILLTDRGKEILTIRDRLNPVIKLEV
ncbi:MAG: Xaa-Pro peptidase family protein [Deltaproteobacteria bacterium]|nr:Xaa-Pro peptidase family protein [Deltaproteobacteria bacterium]MCL5793009.1 Xaa-Pro peptidase family protein [Deltaproteobacteria bacterium]